MDFGGNPYTLQHLAAYTDTAARLGFSALSVNDHMVFSVPWLDGPTALAAMIERSGAMTLATTVSLPIIRGPVPLAKTLAAIDRLSQGRLVVAVGPGSSEKDFDSVGVEFAERWARLEESIGVLRAVWRSTSTPFVGNFYSTDGISLDPHPTRPEGPDIWLGSWGSPAGLRRTARLADGWLASAYNTTPEMFGEAWARLRDLLPAHRSGREPGQRYARGAA
jgi:alkanesulfonate monooxygenase SsuD/methylene tetrahydromethanopterin reductase-like flavin-dependent oxidoreductase (luciferase family)